MVEDKESSFEAALHLQNMPSIQKLNYLIACLNEDVLLVIRSYGYNPENYGASLNNRSTITYLHFIKKDNREWNNYKNDEGANGSPVTMAATVADNHIRETYMMFKEQTSSSNEMVGIRKYESRKITFGIQTIVGNVKNIQNTNHETNADHEQELARKTGLKLLGSNGIITNIIHETGRSQKEASRPNAKYYDTCFMDISERAMELALYARRSNKLPCKPREDKNDRSWLWQLKEKWSDDKIIEKAS
ncbi:hypothetical protein DINM_000391 [Dirofilaria immitis]|nr:hypothetical protein [Dirofilaria immitis]